MALTLGSVNEVINLICLSAATRDEICPAGNQTSFISIKKDQTFFLLNKENSLILTASAVYMREPSSFGNSTAPRLQFGLINSRG